MNIRRFGARTVTVFGAGLLALACTPLAQAQVKLEYKFPEGQTLSYKSTTKTHQILTINGMEIPTDADQTVVESRAIGQRRDDASLPVTMKVGSLRMSLSFPGGEVSFDSSDPDAKIENEQLAFIGEVLKLAAHAQHTVVLDGENRVRTVEGTEKMLEEAEKLAPQARDLVKSQVSVEKIRREFERDHGNLPDVLARPGDTWERDETMEIGGGQTLQFHKKYAYAGTEKTGDKTYDKITGKATEVKYSMDPNAQSPLKVTKSDLKVESSDVTVLFDREAGRVVSSHSKSTIKGTMGFSVNNMDLPGELDLTLEQTQELQPAAK